MGDQTKITAEKIPSKVPQLTLIFWNIKIAATTLGETGGDAVSMSMNLGYLVGTAIFAAIFLLAVSFQIKARCFYFWFYGWPRWRLGRKACEQLTRKIDAICGEAPAFR